MPATIGTSDSALFEHLRPDLLDAVTGCEPDPVGTHVSLEEIGVQSTQRLTLAEHGGAVIAGMWPGELQRQARFLYAGGRGSALAAAAPRYGWRIKIKPQLAFRNSHARERLYLDPDPDVTVETYIRNWELGDLARVRAYSETQIRTDVWKWLKRLRYATDADDPLLDQFFTTLGKRQAHLRPGLQLLQEWAPGDGVAASIRRAVDGVLGAVGDKQLPR